MVTPEDLAPMPGFVFTWLRIDGGPCEKYEAVKPADINTAIRRLSLNPLKTGAKGMLLLLPPSLHTVKLQLDFNTWATVIARRAGELVPYLESRRMENDGKKITFPFAENVFILGILLTDKKVNRRSVFETCRIGK